MKDGMEMDVTIRLARPSDALDFAEIHARSWEVAYKDIIPAYYMIPKNAARPALWQRILTDENTSKYKIECDGKTVGFIDIDTALDSDLDDDYYELRGIYLHPDYFRMGIGSKAMAFALQTARDKDKKHMVVWVIEDNLNSINFYKKHGFVADGKTEIHDFGKPVNSIRMRRAL